MEQTPKWPEARLDRQVSGEVQSLGWPIPKTLPRKCQIESRGVEVDCEGEPRAHPPLGLGESFGDWRS